MSLDNKFLQDIRLFIATISIGPSALRNQGAPGVLRAAREYLSKMDLTPFGTSSEYKFRFALNDNTERLRRSLPKRAKNWGAARKGINLYLRDCMYNVFLNERFRLSCAESFYEIPLDSVVAKRLRKIDSSLPKWCGLKRVTSRESALYQEIALRHAKTNEIHRVHLDIAFWTEGR